MVELLNFLVIKSVGYRSLMARLILISAGALLLAACSEPASVSTDKPSGQASDEFIEKLMAPDELAELSLGNKDAKVTIIEYMSMSCPACATFHKTTLPKLKEQYIDTGKVRFVMREFPLNNLAAAGAMLARCAGSADQSIALIDVLFEKQREWASDRAVEELSTIAKQAGFTQERFDSCMKDDELLGKLTRRRDRADKEFGVDATPSFFINGMRMRGGSFKIEAFEKMLEPLLKGA